MYSGSRHLRSTLRKTGCITFIIMAEKDSQNQFSSTDLIAFTELSQYFI